MTVYYADTSVLVKRHVRETGSAWVDAITDPAAGNAIITARITIIELYSALNRRVRELSLSSSDYHLAAGDVTALFATEYQIVDYTPVLVTYARAFLERHPLRAYDALQLASAIYANTILRSAGTPLITFLASDNALRTAAQSEGLAVDDPQAHP